MPWTGLNITEQREQFVVRATSRKPTFQKDLRTLRNLTHNGIRVGQSLSGSGEFAGTQRAKSPSAPSPKQNKAGHRGQRLGVKSLDPNRSPGDEYVVKGREIYLWLPNGFGRSKLSNAYFDSKLATVSTARNWRTVLKLTEMAISI